MSCFSLCLGYAQGDDPLPSLIEAKGTYFAQERLIKRYHGFNGFSEEPLPEYPPISKKFRKLTLSGSVKESNTTDYIGTLRTEFSGTATFSGQNMTNELKRTEFLNLDSPSSEGSGTTNFNDNAQVATLRHNLKSDYVYSPADSLFTNSQISVINATRRETTGAANKEWDRYHFPYNSFTFHPGPDVYHSTGPIVEELSEPVEPVVHSHNPAGVPSALGQPVAYLKYQLVNAATWVPLSTTPAELDEVFFQGIAEFEIPTVELAGKSAVLFLKIQVKQGNGSYQNDVRRMVVKLERSPVNSDMAEAKFQLKAEKIGQSIKFISAALELDLAQCGVASGGGGDCGAGGGGGGCGGEPGTTAAALASVNWSMNLGRIAGGNSAGILELHAQTWSSQLYTPALLKFVPGGFKNSAEAVVRRADGTLRQLRTGTYLTDIVIPSEDQSLPANSYEVRFYAEADSTPIQPGSTLFVPASDPLYVVRFSDPDGNGNRMLIKRFAGLQTTPVSSLEYAFEASTNTWKFTEGGLRRTERKVTTLSATEEEVLTTVWTIQANGQETKASEISEKYRTYVVSGFTQKVVYERSLDPSGANLVSTWNYDVPLYQLKLTQANYHNGSWLVSDTNDDTFTPFINSAPGVAPARLKSGYGDASSYQSQEVIGGMGYESGPFGTTLRFSRGRRQNTVVQFDGKPCIVSEQATRAEYFYDDDPWNGEKRYTYANGTFAGRTAYIRHPDRTIETFTYALNEATGKVTEIHSVGAPDTSLLVVVDGRRTTTVTDADGRLVIRSTVNIKTGDAQNDGALLEREEVTDNDATYGRPTEIILTDGTVEKREYFPCCGLLSRLERHGVITQYEYDAIGRRISETVGAGTLWVTTLFTYDAMDRVIKTIRKGSDGSEVVLEQVSYDLAGRLTSRVDALNRETTYSEIYNPDRTTTRTTTYPDLTTMFEVINADGSLASRTGTRVHPVYYEYVADWSLDEESQDGCIVTTEFKGSPGSSPADWVKTYVNGLGLLRTVVYADNEKEFSVYDGANRLVKRTDPDGVTELFTYNARGERELAVVDMNANGLVDATGTDRISKTSTEVANRDGYTVYRTTAQVWETDGQNTPVTVAESEQSADGLRSWEYSRGCSVPSRSVTVYKANGEKEVTNTASDDSITTQIYFAGRLVSTSHPALGAVTYQYDPHGRLLSQTDLRSGATTYSYYADDQIHKVITPDPDLSKSGPGYDPQETVFTYDSAGRSSTVTHADGGVVTTEYHLTGEVKKVTGARTYQVEYAYDNQGRLKELFTWQAEGNNATKAKTTWDYDPVRGWLTGKRYHDDNGPAYTYTSAGRLHVRTWARGIATTYGYDNAGNVTTVNYSDDTPDVALTYDRAGRLKTRQDAAGICTWSYHANGQLEIETYGDGPLVGIAVDRDFDNLRRLTGVSVPSVYAAGYTYDAASRLRTVTSGTNEASYVYVTNSTLIDKITFMQNGAERFVTTKVHDKLNRLERISNSHLPATSTYAYSYNSANQRTRVTRENNMRWDYTYDSLGQMDKAQKRLGDLTNTLVSGNDFEYDFDDIGNRTKTTINAQVSDYSPNLLNQYSARTVPGVIEVSGAAQADATVTVMSPAVNGTIYPTTRQDELFYRQVPVNNTASSQYAGVKITGVKNNVGPNGEDAIAEETRQLLVSGTPETFSHDLDGNLTGDAKWTYAWDGENRLIAMESSVAAVAAGASKLKLEFAYDGQGRRVSKKVSNWSNNAWVLDRRTHFLYDGWNLIAEMNGLASNAATRTYVWGLDLSGSKQGAGGVGGLLFANVQVPSLATHAAAYDGNGNVVAFVDMLTGTKSATYEYGAFGEMLIADGVAAEVMTFRFSTKFTDGESGLLYYGLRYYSPSTGRWLSRDPIEEGGGLNLYGFCGNDGVSNVDPFGAYEVDFHYYVIYYLLRAKCWTSQEAQNVAGWSQYVDDNAKTEPLFTSEENRAHYHFPGSNMVRPTLHDWPDARYALIDAVNGYSKGGFGSAARLGAALHTYADTWPHEGFTAYWHTMNDRGGVGPEVGHANTGEGGHAPDRPYNNPQHALDAARYIYERLPSKCASNCPQLDWQRIESDLRYAFVPKREATKAREAAMQSIIRSRFGDNTSYELNRYELLNDYFENALGIRP